MRIPMAIELLIIEDNPLLKNGSGSPVFGRIDVATPMLKKIWKQNMEPIPIAIIIPI